MVVDNNSNILYSKSFEENYMKTKAQVLDIVMNSTVYMDVVVDSEVDDYRIISSNIVNGIVAKDLENEWGESFKTLQAFDATLISDVLSIAVDRIVALQKLDPGKLFEYIQSKKLFRRIANLYVCIDGVGDHFAIDGNVLYHKDLLIFKVR